MRRRRALQSLAAAPFALTGRWRMQAPSAEARRVTVTGGQIFRVHVNARGNWVVVRVETSAGITGIGEASHGGTGDPQLARLREYLDVLQGRSVYDIEWLRQRVGPDVAREGRLAATAFSGIEQALWDIAGQLAGVPVFQLFGGRVREEIRCYANINRSTDPRTPAGFAAMAADAVEAGFAAVKLAPFDGLPNDGTSAEIQAFTRRGLEAVAAVRDVLGPQGDLLVDAHSNFDLDRGLALVRSLEPYALFWLEEVVPALADLGAINRAAPMPTAGGESLLSLRQNVDYLRAEAADILMPDLKFCGGLSGLRHVAAVAEGFDVSISPHGPAGPVAHLAAAHVCAGLHHFLIHEYAYGEAPWRAELIDPPETFEQGSLVLSDRPGLGIRLNEPVATRQRVM